MVAGVGAVHGLFAVNLNDAAVLNVPRVLQLVEDVTGLIFDQQSRAGRPEGPPSPKQNQKHQTLINNFSTNQLLMSRDSLQTAEATGSSSSA